MELLVDYVSIAISVIRLKLKSIKINQKINLTSLLGKMTGTIKGKSIKCTISLTCVHAETIFSDAVHTAVTSFELSLRFTLVLLY